MHFRLYAHFILMIINENVIQASQSKINAHINRHTQQVERPTFPSQEVIYLGVKLTSDPQQNMAVCCQGAVGQTHTHTYCIVTDREGPPPHSSRTHIIKTRHKWSIVPLGFSGPIDEVWSSITGLSWGLDVQCEAEEIHMWSSTLNNRHFACRMFVCCCGLFSIFIFRLCCCERCGAAVGCVSRSGESGCSNESTGFPSSQ